MLSKLSVGVVLLAILSIAVFAIHTAETRYSVDPNEAEDRNIVKIENRYGISYTQPLGGFGSKGASRSSFGAKGEEEGASNLASNSYILRGTSPSKISNSYASARGYRVINEYVKLESVPSVVIQRPQISGVPVGHARIISKKSKDIYLPQTNVILRTRDLPKATATTVYEAWLVDEDTGFSMSLGVFQTSEISRIGLLNYESMTPINMFESIVVTEETFPDDDPNPGRIVLSGNIEENIVRAYR